MGSNDILFLLSLITRIAENHFGDELNAYSPALLDVGATAFKQVLIAAQNGEDVIDVMARSREAARLAMIDAAPNYVLSHRQ